LTTPDPLLRNVSTFRVSVRDILGVPVSFETNSDAVAAIIEDLYRAWPQREAEAGYQATVMLIEQDTPLPESEVGTVYRMPSPTRLLVAADGAVGVAEIDRRMAYGYVTRSALDRGDDFAVGFVDALTMALATANDRHPVHAATLVRDGLGILLVGRSGAGKSSVAYAARKRGFEVRGEDVAYVQREPELRVWAKPGPYRLWGEVGRHFPELAGHPVTALANGKLKMIVPAERASATPVVDAVPVILTPGEVLSLERLAPEEVAAALSETPEVGFDLFVGQAPDVARLLGADGGWRLHLSRDPHEAAEALDRLARETRPTSG
jgi:hypothetical protein